MKNNVQSDIQMCRQFHSILMLLFTPYLTLCLSVVFFFCIDGNDKHVIVIVIVAFKYICMKIEEKEAAAAATYNNNNASI